MSRQPHFMILIKISGGYASSSKSPSRVIIMKHLTLIVVFLALMITVPALAGQTQAVQATPGDRARIGVSVPMAVHGWTGAVIWWAKDEMAQLDQKYKNLDFIFVTANTPEKQVADISAMIDQEVSALVVLPISDEPLTSILEKAKQKGIFIVAVDRISPNLSRDVLVTADNEAIGRMCGEILAEAIGGRGDIVIMEALPSSINTMRVNAFKKVMAKYPDIHILDSRHVNWNLMTGQEVMENFLQAYPHLDAIWTGDDSILTRVLTVYEKSGRTDLKLILGLGGSKEVVKMIRDGHPLVQATINYPATIISDSIRAAAEHVMENKDFGPEIGIICEKVDRTNAQAFYNPQSPY